MGEFAEEQVHLDEFGETQKRYGDSTDTLNEKPLLNKPINLNSLQNVYRSFHDQYDLHHKDNYRIYGVGGGEMGELAERLVKTREERDEEQSIKMQKTPNRKRENVKRSLLVLFSCLWKRLVENI